MKKKVFFVLCLFLSFALFAQTLRPGYRMTDRTAGVYIIYLASGQTWYQLGSGGEIFNTNDTPRRVTFTVYFEDGSKEGITEIVPGNSSSYFAVSAVWTKIKEVKIDLVVRF